MGRRGARWRDHCCCGRASLQKRHFHDDALAADATVFEAIRVLFMVCRRIRVPGSRCMGAPKSKGSSGAGNAERSL